MDEGGLKKSVHCDRESNQAPQQRRRAINPLCPTIALVYDMFITWATGCMCNTSRVQSTLKPKFDESVAPNNAMTSRTVLMVNGN